MRWVLIICIIFGMVSCREEPVPTFTLVVPNDFRGIVILRWEKPEGVKLPDDESNYKLHIPPSGVLEIQGKNLMLEWHVLEAAYASMQALPKGDQHTKDEVGIYFWSMGLNREADESWFVVGKIKDLEGVLEQKMGLKPFSNLPRDDK